MHTAFFEPAGPDAFVATSATIGPWSAQSQHGGPPAAPAGTGVASSILSGPAGPCGRGAQAVLVAPR